MKLGIGKLRMSPAEFWDCSLAEFLLAVEGFAEFHSDGKAAPMRKDELQDLMELYPD